MNEVEIVVKSTDKTSVTAIGQRFKTSLSQSVKAGVDDVDRTVATRFREIGDRGGTALSNGLKNGTRAAAQAIDGASVAARKMGLAVQEAADRASRAERAAAAAADRFKAAQEVAAAAAKAAAEAAAKLERGEIEEAEAAKLTAEAARRAADAEREKEHATDAATRASRAAVRADLAHAAAAESAAKATGKSLVDRVRESSAIIKGPLVLGAIAVAIQALPTIATVAGGGIALGLGAGLSAIGIKAAAANADVKANFTDLRKHVSLETQIISFAWQKTLKDVSADGKIAFDSLAPSLQSAFDEMSPAVDRFAFNFASSMHELDPAIKSVGTAFSRTLDELGARAPAIMNNLGTSVKAITDAVAANPDAFADLAEGVSLFARGVGDSIGFLIRFEHEINTVFRTANAFALGPVGILADGALRLKSAFSQAGDGLQIVERTFPSFSQQATVAAAAAHHLMTAQQAAALTAGQLKTAMDSLTGKALTEREALVQYRQAIGAMTKALKDNGHAHGFATQKGAANEQALDQMAVAAQKAAQAMKADGRSAQDVGHFLEGARQRIIAAAEKMHYSASAARDLADKLLGVKSAADKIPHQKSTTLKDNTAAARARMQALQHSINALHGKTVNIYQVMHLTTTQAYLNKRRNILGYAHGGISGGGGGGYAHGGVFGGVGLSRAAQAAVSSAARTLASHAAEGGPRSNMALVGEQGAELVRLPTGSTVIPHGQSMAMLGGMGGGGEQRLLVEWVGGNAGDTFMTWLRENIRFRAGGGPDSVQKALGQR